MTATDRRTLHACASVFFTLMFWAGSGLVINPGLSAQTSTTAPAPPAPQPPPAVEPPAPPAAPHGDWQPSHDHDGVRVTFDRGDRVRIGGPVIVAAGERADDVVAIFGDVIVRGEVRGEAVAVMGSVRVEDGGIVRRDVTAVGGIIESAPTARIYGDASQVSIGWPGSLPHEPWRGEHFRLSLGEPLRWLANVLFVGTSVRIAVTLFLALLIVIGGGAGLRRQIDTIASRPGEVFITGIGAELLLPIAFIGLALTLTISILGIPLLPVLPLLALVVALVWVVGFAAATTALGRGVLRTVGVSAPNDVVALIVGAIPVFLLTVISRIAWVNASGFPGWSIGVALGGALVEWLVWTLGLGTLALTWMRRQGPAPSVPTSHAPIDPPTPPVPVEV
ncbi:MAG: hypothetical protein JNM38_08190 [Acidobacteria bacterium]|nr:hypothetical protein [Acidobacteriota bacterium]